MIVTFSGVVTLSVRAACHVPEPELARVCRPSEGTLLHDHQHNQRFIIQYSTLCWRSGAARCGAVRWVHTNVQRRSSPRTPGTERSTITTLPPPPLAAPAKHRRRTKMLPHRHRGFLSVAKAQSSDSNRYQFPRSSRAAAAEQARRGVAGRWPFDRRVVLCCVVLCASQCSLVSFFIYFCTYYCYYLYSLSVFVCLYRGHIIRRTGRRKNGF